jgi:cysteine desulfurase
MGLFKRKRIYLDWASSAPVARSAMRAFVGAFRTYGNPSSPHEEGVRAKKLLEESRTTLARHMEVKPSGVVFTSGATEANNLALFGYVQNLKEKGIVDVQVLYLPSAHASIIEGVERLKKEGVKADSLPVKEGRIDLVAMQSLLTPATRLVLLDAVCSETGTRWDTRGVRTVLDAYTREAKGDHIALHVDASQAPLALPTSLTRFSADMLTLDAQKIGGVRGIGALCMRSHVALTPLLLGGGQEGGRRAGTEAVMLAAAFAEALTVAQQKQERFSIRATRMRNNLIEDLSATVNQGAEGVPNILNISLPERDTDYLVMLLDAAGFAVSTKSACETDSETGSRAVRLLTNDDARARATLRISWGPTTKARDLRRFSRALLHAIRFLEGASVY